MSRNCPYCKIDFDAEPRAEPKSGRTVCFNCRYYAEAIAMNKDDEIQWFDRYWAIPINWRSFEGWKTDPYYLKANKPHGF